MMNPQTVIHDHNTTMLRFYSFSLFLLALLPDKYQSKSRVTYCGWMGDLIQIRTDPSTLVTGAPS